MSDKLKVTIELEPLFEFHSFQQWVNKAASWCRNSGIPSQFLIAVDTQGRVCKSGWQFERANTEGTFPIVFYSVYEPAPKPTKLKGARQ